VSVREWLTKGAEKWRKIFFTPAMGARAQGVLGGTPWPHPHCHTGAHPGHGGDSS